MYVCLSVCTLVSSGVSSGDVIVRRGTGLPAMV